MSPAGGGRTFSGEVYHGTSHEAAAAIKAGGFDRSKSGSGGTNVYGAGLYSTTNKSMAEGFAKAHGGEVVAMQADLKNAVPGDHPDVAKAEKVEQIYGPVAAAAKAGINSDLLAQVRSQMETGAGGRPAWLSQQEADAVLSQASRYGGGGKHAMTAYLEGKGYDGVLVGDEAKPSEVVAFDKKSLKMQGMGTRPKSVSHTGAPAFAAAPAAAPPAAARPGMRFKNLPGGAGFGDEKNWKAIADELTKGRKAGMMPVLPGSEGMIARAAFSQWGNQDDYNRIRAAIPMARGAGNANLAINDKLPPNASATARKIYNDNRQATAVLRAYNHAPVSTVPLYRGMRTGGKALTVGAHLKIGVPSSFSTSKWEAQGFAKEGHGVLIEVEPGAKALDISRLNSWNEEHVSMGKYEVLSRETDADGLTHVKVRQVHGGLA